MGAREIVSRLADRLPRRRSSTRAPVLVYGRHDAGYGANISINRIELSRSSNPLCPFVRGRRIWLVCLDGERMEARYRALGAGQAMAIEPRGSISR